MEPLREALRRLAKAVVVITSEHEGRRYAMTATAVSELSFAPPSMLICVNESASMFPALAAGADFGINILHHSQQPIADHCAGALSGEERFGRGTWGSGPLGIPRLLAAQAFIACSNAHGMRHGTHGIFIGNVVEASTAGSPDPLIYLDRRFTRAIPHAPDATATA